MLIRGKAFRGCLLGMIFLGTSCVSRKQVVDDYDHKIKIEYQNQSTPPQTLVFILIDGFSVPLVQKLFSEGNAPNIRNFFLKDKNEFRLARATFPSLTHVNISSIVTSRNVDQHPISGNKIFIDGKILNFESPFTQKTFSELIKPYSVFENLTRQGRTSLSFAPFYGDQATSRYGLDLKMGLAYRGGDYAYVDGELLQSMNFALTKLPLNQWPELIFVHVIGIDATEHHKGHLSKGSIEYSRFVDSRLRPIFELLESASQQGRKIGVIMTSDHGMSELKSVVHIEEEILKITPNSTIINQGRLMSLYFPKTMSIESRRMVSRSIAQMPGVEMTALKSFKDLELVEEFSLELITSSKTYNIQYKNQNCGRDGAYSIKLEKLPYLCASSLNKKSEKFFYPYLATNMAAYFKSSSAPDAVILAQENTSFGDSIHAHHGGMTEDEIHVPLLLWNVDVKSAEKTPQTFRLLESFRSSK